jgi:hypothetical protein
LPPWHERLPTGEVDRTRPYGPSLELYEKQCTDFRQSIWGGGLFDEEEHRRCGGGRLRTDKARLRRYDEDEIGEFVEENQGRLTKRQLEVYLCFWVERMSYGQAAGFLKTTTRAVRLAVQRLRKAAKSG